MLKQNQNGTLASDCSDTLIRHDTAGTLNSPSFNNTGIDFGDSTLIQHRTLADTENNKHLSTTSSSRNFLDRVSEGNYESFNRAFANKLDLDNQNNAIHKLSDSHSSIPPPPSYDQTRAQQQRQQEQMNQSQQAARKSSDSASWCSSTIDSQFRKAMNEPLPDFRFVSF